MRPFRRMALALSLLLLLLLGNLTWIQVLNADAIRAHPDNTRILLEQYNKPRGPILVESTPIAISSRSAGSDVYQRTYLNGALYAAATGYYSLLYGATGIEQYENTVLSGSDSRFFVDRVQQLFAGRKRAVGAVTLTLNSAAQQAAFNVLKDHAGAVVALTPNTGAILALTSSPTFDPQALAPNDPDTVRAAYDALVADPKQPLVNRAIHTAYAPGSLLNLVTVTAALASGKFTLKSEIPGPASFTVPQTSSTIATSTRTPCTSSGTLSVEKALQSSCSTAMAWLGSELGADALRNAAEQFGFNAAIGIPTRVSVSRIVDGAAVITSPSDIRATPMAMAMVAASLANGGSLMQPYLVKEIRGPDLSVLDHAIPHELATPTSHRTASAIAAVMQQITQKQCPECQIVGAPIAAVTATVGTRAWALAFTDHVAVAILLEDGSVSDALLAATSVIRSVIANY